MNGRWFRIFCWFQSLLRTWRADEFRLSSTVVEIDRGNYKSCVARYTFALLAVVLNKYKIAKLKHRFSMNTPTAFISSTSSTLTILVWSSTLPFLLPLPSSVILVKKDSRRVKWHTFHICMACQWLGCDGTQDRNHSLFRNKETKTNRTLLLV